MKSLSLKLKIIIMGGALLVLLSLWVIPGPDRQGATVAITPNNRMSQHGQEWTAKVMVHSNQPVNAADVVLVYPKDLVEVNEVSQKNSRFETSVFEPKHDQAKGEVHFVQATLEPFTGDNGLLGEVEFRAKKPGKSLIQISKGVIVAHDGKGTDVFHSTLAQSVGEWLVGGLVAQWQSVVKH